MIADFSPTLMASLMLVLLIVAIMFGHPIAFVFGGLGVIFGLLIRGPAVFFLFTSQVMGVMDSWLLIAITMFIFMANLLVQSGIADALFDSLRYLVGPLKGGVAIAVIIVCTVLAACTGVVGASVVSMGLAALPVMLKYRYDKGLAAGAICAGGTLGILIPPSIMMIALADLTGLSAGKLLIGGIFPGLILSSLYVGYIGIICQRRPEMGPALSLEERAAVPVRKRLIRAAESLLPPGVLILSVLGIIFTGIATPTEASAVGAFIAFLMTFVYRRFSFRMLRDAVMSTAKTVCMVMIIIVATNCYTAVFLDLGGGAVLKDFMLGLGLGRWGAFFIMMLIIFILGMPIEWVGIIYLVMPVFLPVATELGFDPLWFTICVAVNLQNAFISPPAGASMFYLQGISQGTLTTADIFRGMWPFVGLQLIGLTICIAFPSMVLYLPNLIK